MNDHDTNDPPLDLDALAALEAAATPGPWTADLDPHGETRGIWPTGPGEEIVIGSYVAADGFDSQGWAGGSDEHLTFLVALRNAAPALIAAARENDDLRASLGEVQRQTSEGYERAAASLSRRVDLAMEVARLRAERDAAQAALDAAMVTARNRLDAVRKLRESIERVESLHGAEGSGDCTGCGSDGFERVLWPCATISAIRGDEQEIDRG